MKSSIYFSLIVFMLGVTLTLKAEELQVCSPNVTKAFSEQIASCAIDDYDNRELVTSCIITSELTRAFLNEKKCKNPEYNESFTNPTSIKSFKIIDLESIAEIQGELTYEGYSNFDNSIGVKECGYFVNMDIQDTDEMCNKRNLNTTLGKANCKSSLEKILDLYKGLNCSVRLERQAIYKDFQQLYETLFK